ncbi:MAG: hypothetical protein GY853_15210, partial [PVC group bacterium]|nr:hypothetical protein [PVC group bacterium]
MSGTKHIDRFEQTEEEIKLLIQENNRHNNNSATMDNQDGDNDPEAAAQVHELRFPLQRDPKPPVDNEQQLNPQPQSPPPDPELLEAPVHVQLHPLPNEPENLDNLVDYPPIEAAEINILCIEPKLPELPLGQLQDEGEEAIVGAEQENESIEAEVEQNVNKNLEIEAELNANENIEPELKENTDANAMAGDGNAQEDMQHAIKTLQHELKHMQDGDRDRQTGSDTPLFHGRSNEDFQTVQEAYNIARQFETNRFLLHAATPAPVSANQTTETVPKLLYHSQNQSQ